MGYQSGNGGLGADAVIEPERNEPGPGSWCFPGLGMVAGARFELATFGL